MSEEIWKKVSDFDDYIVSNHGRVAKVLKCTKDCRGYMRAHLSKKDGKSNIFVHRLVMKAFRPNEKSEELFVNHIDGDKTNNNLDNLEWCTHKENMEHAFRTGLIKKKIRPIYCYETDEVYTNAHEAARAVFNATGRRLHNKSTRILSVCDPRSTNTQHKGYHFKYADKEID